MNTETLKRDINELIDFYEQYKPDDGQQIRVYATPKDLARALMLPYGNVQETKEFNYRGRTLVAIGPRSECQSIRQ